jgi:hypothetical protein
LQAVFGRNADCPVAVLSARSPSDCFDVAIEAVRLATRYMTPVIVLTDGYTVQSVPDGVNSTPFQDATFPPFEDPPSDGDGLDRLVDRPGPDGVGLHQLSLPQRSYDRSGDGIGVGCGGYFEDLHLNPLPDYLAPPFYGEVEAVEQQLPEVRIPHPVE